MQKLILALLTTLILLTSNLKAQEFPSEIPALVSQDTQYVEYGGNKFMIVGDDVYEVFPDTVKPQSTINMYTDSIYYPAHDVHKIIFRNQLDDKEVVTFRQTHIINGETLTNPTTTYTVPEFETYTVYQGCATEGDFEVISRFLKNKEYNKPYKGYSGIAGTDTLTWHYHEGPLWTFGIDSRVTYKEVGTSNHEDSVLKYVVQIVADNIIVAVDINGNTYVADTIHGCSRKVGKLTNENTHRLYQFLLR